MKIALFTCHHDLNYGSMLQAYALAAALRRLGVDSEYLNYSTSPDPNSFWRVVKRGIKALLKLLFGVLHRPKHIGEFAFFQTPEFDDTIKAYEKFHREYIPTSTKKYYFDTVCKQLNVSDYDIYMVGSDQSWSPNLYDSKKPYFLDFADLPKRVAYAPSFGCTRFSDDYISLLIQKLSKFQQLSCREQTNCKLLTGLLGQEVTYVLDPTLLLDQNEWNKIAVEPKIEREYILAYILGEKDTVITFAENLGKAKSLPVYYIVTRPKYLKMPKALNGIGPAEWVGLIKNAKYVVTDSFHGCLFCINYNINFYAFSKREGSLNTQDNVRIFEFLNIWGLQSRFQDDKQHPSILEDIDFTEANKKVDDMRVISEQYLSHCLEQ